MRILTKDNHVDFEAPIQMTEDQRKKFISFMKGLFDNIDVENVEEKYKEMGERKNIFLNMVLLSLTYLKNNII